jgi:2-oxoglutarate ferredoxin oxidoreductase subunit beta
VVLASSYIENIKLRTVVNKSEIKISYDEGDSKTVELHDGSNLQLHKLTSGWDPTNKDSSFKMLHESRNKGEILTGLIYIDTKTTELHDVIKTSKTPLNSLTQTQLTPSVDVLEAINQEYR